MDVIETPQSTPIEWRSMRGLLQVIVVLQLFIIAGIVVVYLQFDGLPARIPQPFVSDPSGQIYQLQQSVDAISTDLQAMRGMLESLSSAAPSPGTP